ncbi:MAG: histidine phosphatase family protein [Bacteroidota bacterium]
MKTVYLIRHAKSSWKDPALKDIERPLNKRGFRDAPFMANLLNGKGVKPNRLITSPANRAYTTATFFAEVLGIPKPSIDVRKKIYEAYPNDILSLIKYLPNEWSVICLFGHNPTFTSLANLFSEEYIPNVPTCGIVHIEASVASWDAFHPDHAKVVDFHYPKQYFD